MFQVQVKCWYDLAAVMLTVRCDDFDILRALGRICALIPTLRLFCKARRPANWQLGITEASNSGHGHGHTAMRDLSNIVVTSSSIFI